VDAASARSAGKKQARCSNFLVGSPSLRTDIIYVEMACLGKEEEISDYARSGFEDCRGKAVGEKKDLGDLHTSFSFVSDLSDSKNCLRTYSYFRGDLRAMKLEKKWLYCTVSQRCNPYMILKRNQMESADCIPNSEWY
jgi:hypothetical protein